MSELSRSTILTGLVFAIGIGGAIAWWSRPTDTTMPPARASAEPARAADTGDKPVALYKWQDDSGVWNYTDKPPADRAYERVEGTPNVTSVPTIVPEVPGSQQPSTDIPQKSD